MDLEHKAALLTEQLTALILPIVYGVSVAVALTALYGVMIHLTTYAHPELSQDEAAFLIGQLLAADPRRRMS